VNQLLFCGWLLSFVWQNILHSITVLSQLCLRCDIRNWHTQKDGCSEITKEEYHVFRKGLLESKEWWKLSFSFKVEGGIQVPDAIIVSSREKLIYIDSKWLPIVSPWECQTLGALFEQTKVQMPTGTYYFLSSRRCSTRFPRANVQWDPFLGLKIATQFPNFSRKPKKLIYLAANFKSKKTSHRYYAHNRLVEHHLLDRKLINSVGSVALVCSNRAPKVWHHGCIHCWRAICNR